MEDEEASGPVAGVATDESERPESAKSCIAMDCEERKL